MDNSIEYSRTVSKNFQGVKFAIQFSYPDSVRLSQARDLAEFLVRVQITRNWNGMDILKYQSVYQLIFLEPIEHFLDPLKDNKELG